MNRKLTTLAVAALSSIGCFAQDTTTTDVTDVLRITLLSSGVSYEKKIGHLQTVYLHPHVNASGSFSYSSSLGSNLTYYIDPALTLNYRYYYNLDKRLAKEKRTEMNSLNYVGALYDLSLSKSPYSSDHVEESGRRLLHAIGAIWGFQRNYKSNFSLDLNLGLGYHFGKATKVDPFTGRATTTYMAAPTSVGNFTLGFWLNRK